MNLRVPIRKRETRAKIVENGRPIAGKLIQSRLIQIAGGIDEKVSKVDGFWSHIDKQKCFSRTGRTEIGCLKKESINIRVKQARLTNETTRIKIGRAHV